MSQSSPLTRRGFTTTAVAAGAAALCAPFVRASAKSGLRRPILGYGAFEYETIHDWIKPPDGLAFGDTHGLAQDRAGRIYVAHTVHGSSSKPHAVCVYDADGTFLNAWGDEFRGGAHGLDIRLEDEGEFLYHCDTRRRLIVKTDLDGRIVWAQGMPTASGKYDNPGRWCPTNVAFAPSGDFFVGDGYGSSYIHRYTRDGAYVRTIVGPGKEAGQVSCPHGLWVDDRKGTPLLVVADRGNRRLQYMTFDGEHVGFVTNGMRQPCHIKFRGDHMLVPDLASVVTILDKDNAPVVHLGDGHPTKLRGAPRDKFLPGKFVHPHDAIWLANGDILVAEWVPIGRVTLLRHV